MIAMRGHCQELKAPKEGPHRGLASFQTDYLGRYESAHQWSPVLKGMSAQSPALDGAWGLSKFENGAPHHHARPSSLLLTSLFFHPCYFPGHCTEYNMLVYMPCPVHATPLSETCPVSLSPPKTSLLLSGCPQVLQHSEFLLKWYM